MAKRKRRDPLAEKKRAAAEKAIQKVEQEHRERESRRKVREATSERYRERLAAHLKEIIEKNVPEDVSFTRFFKDADMDPALVGRYMTGERMPTLYWAARLAQSLGVEASEMILPLE